MAHELMFKDGDAAMMYVGELPWHGLGQRLMKPPTAKEAIKAARIDWRVAKKPMYAMSDGTWYEIPDRYAIVREDLWGTERCPIFATVTGNYIPLQNDEAFAFFDGLIDRKLATYETAGALGDGERVWVLAKLKEDICVGGTDEIQRYILLANGHNAATAVRIILTPVRVVCQNTLSWAAKTAKTEFRIHHGADMHKKLDAAREQLDAILRQYELVADRFGAMVKREMPKQDLQKYLDVVFPLPNRGRLSERHYEAAIAEVRRRDTDCSKVHGTRRGLLSFLRMAAAIGNPASVVLFGRHIMALLIGPTTECVSRIVISGSIHFSLGRPRRSKPARFAAHWTSLGTRKLLRKSKQLI